MLCVNHLKGSVELKMQAKTCHLPMLQILLSSKNRLCPEGHPQNKDSQFHEARFHSRPYETRLKLSGCNEDEFTCDDGQCVAMEERCNQVADCRDESDENSCQVLVLKASYNQRVPPITTVSPENKTIVPAQVETSITLMKVVSMKEVEHSIEFQFQITMEWKENRATYFNLKEDISLNALSKDDIERLWLPLIVYDNTDQKETTRLGMG